MAKKNLTNTDDFEEHIIDISIGDEMKASFLEYSYSVIYARALPDARDGLKPVQRRILYTMDDMNLRPDKGHVKSARVVGEVMGRLHPHGDGAIYDALVRQSQDFSMRVPMVDGHGNFGSPDDPPAAMRYTECRMTQAAVAMTGSIGENTVDFKPNYDGRELEPTVLPAALPNLLVNGGTGIAVGMATNLAPHNLVEVISALRFLITNPKASLDEIMRFIPGPDLPTGGQIIGLAGIREAYETGRGSFKIRATSRIDAVTPRRKGVVVTELPYGIGTEQVIEKIKGLVQSRKLQGISDVKDLTDRTHGTQLVIEIKNGFNPEAVLAQLYKLTPMEQSFSINAVALVDGQPKTLSLLEMLHVFLEHRRVVIQRRSIYRRDKAAAELHLVQGLLIAILDIDEVIQLIRSSDNSSMAKERLIQVFELSDAQATYILDMALRQLTKFSKLELEARRDKLTNQVAELEEILNDAKKLSSVVSSELSQVAKDFGNLRRTVLLEAPAVSTNSAVELEISDDPCSVILATTGLLARTTISTSVAGNRSNHDVILSQVATTARGEIAAITSAGRALKISVLELPALPDTATRPNLAGGLPLGAILQLEKDEKVLGLANFTEPNGIALATASGVIKRVKAESMPNKAEWNLINLSPGDKVIGALELASEMLNFCFITSDAQLLHYPVTLVRPQGRSGSGMAGIKLAANAEVIAFNAVPIDTSQVITVSGASSALPGTDTGMVKRSDFSEFPSKGRATAGVRCHRFLKGEDKLIFAWAGPNPIACAASGNPVQLPEETAKRDASGIPGTQPIDACGTDII